MKRVQVLLWVFLLTAGFLHAQITEVLPVPLGIGNKWVYASGPELSTPSCMYEHIASDVMVDSVSYNVFRLTTAEGTELRHGRRRWDGYHAVRLENYGITNPNREWVYFKENVSVGEYWLNTTAAVNTQYNVVAKIATQVLGEPDTSYSMQAVFFYPPPLPITGRVFYSEKFGLTQVVWSGNIIRKLLGAYINGVVYGDTTFNPAVSVNDENNTIDYSLEQNFPNPFNPSTTVTFTMKEPGNAKLAVYDMLGNEVMVPVNEYKGSGKHTAEIQAAGLSSGVYIYTLQVNGYVLRKSFVLLK